MGSRSSKKYYKAVNDAAESGKDPEMVKGWIGNLPSDLKNEINQGYGLLKAQCQLWSANKSKDDLIQKCLGGVTSIGKLVNSSAVAGMISAFSKPQCDLLDKFF